ncbi:MAG TPA: hypothetical protein VFC68_04280, partial [Treponemataceae bacterium]|nr:hypothetical protein [Treponemataceae bacterium]
MIKSFYLRNILFSLLFLYETIHTFFVLFCHKTAVLPLSWYLSVPLMFLPFIFLYNISTQTKEKPFSIYL